MGMFVSITASGRPGPRPRFLARGLARALAARLAELDHPPAEEAQALERWALEDVAGDRAHDAALSTSPGYPPFDLALSLALDAVIVELERPGLPLAAWLALRGQKAALEHVAGLGEGPGARYVDRGTP